MQSPGEIGDMRVSSTGVKFRFKNIPTAKKKESKKKITVHSVSF